MITSYRDLEVYKESYSLALKMHKMTKKYPEYEKFGMSLGSCNEVQVLLDISKDLGYITGDQHQEMWERYDVLGKRISTLIERWQ